MGKMKKLLSALLLVLVVVAFALSGNALFVSVSAESSGDNWSTFRHDAQRTGHSTSPAPSTNEVMWVYNTTFEVVTGPAVLDGKVIAVLINGDVYALNATTGEKIWLKSLGAGQNLVNLVWSSPAVDSGRIYLGTRDNNVYCLNESNGDVLWSYPTGSQINSSPLVNSGQLYISSDDGKLYCLNAVDGSFKWSFSMSNTSANDFSSPAIWNNVVYVGSSGANPNNNGSNVFALDAFSGTLKWMYAVEGGGTTAAPAISDGKVFVGSGNGRMYSLDASNGSLIWNATIGSGSSGVFGEIYMSSPAVADNLVFVGAGDGNVYCLNASSGLQVWESPTGREIWSSPAVADGKVFIGSSDGKIYCFDENTGAQLWSYYTLGRVVSSPAVYNGTVYVGCGTSMSAEGKIFAFGAKYSVPTDLTLNLNSQTSFLGFKVNLNGTVSANQTGIAGAAVQLSYSINEGQTWNDITSVDTASDGTYSAVWVPSATGTYTVRALWTGTYPYEAAQVQRTLSVTSFNDQYVFSVASNSTVSALSFNSTSNELSFTVAGPSGTTGFVDLGIAKSLVSNIANLKVFLDGANLNYTVTSTADSWFLQFTYSHSTHDLLINLGANLSSPSPSTNLTPNTSPTPTPSPTSSPIPSPTESSGNQPSDVYYIIATAAIVAIVILAALLFAYRKKHKQALSN